MLRGGKLYIIWNDKNDKVYVGITSRRLSRRFHEHVYASLNHKDKFQFHSAIRKYGEEHFHMECLLDDVPMPEYIREKLLAAHVGKKHSEETRRKMSEARKGRKPFLGRKHSAETRLKMSRSQNERFNNERRYV
jgi:group I intron endonuclease